MSESNILQRTLIKIGALPFGRFWRMNAGLAWSGKPVRLTPGQRYVAEHGDLLLKNGHPVKLGPPGISDIIGIVSVIITPEMVGQKIGVLFGLEAKTDKGAQETAQKAFEAMITTMGGKYYIFRSPEECLEILKNFANTDTQQ